MTGSTGAEIEELQALEILDSRGRPTLEVTVRSAGGAVARAGVPSGASTGSGEVAERRDGDPGRFGGDGVATVVATVEGEIADLVVGRRWRSIEDLDRALCTLDGTSDKRRLGGNAIVGVSMAFARALALEAEIPLFRLLAVPGVAPRLPVPHFNVVNGGAHARNRLDFQEFMVAPVGAPSMAEAVRAGAEVTAALRSKLDGLGLSTSLGDEGGFAPALQAPEDVLDLLVEAIEAAGYVPGPDGIALALDPAANGFRGADGRYRVNGTQYDSSELVEHVSWLVDRYPIWSVEDGMAEDDPEGWRALTERIGGHVQLVGDDNLVTSAARITQAAAERRGTAALIKVNQVGTVTETLEALAACRASGFAAMVSHRSGETCDDFIADLAVAAGCGQIKAGAPARGERLAKYNRLVAIGRAAPDLPYGLPAG